MATQLIKIVTETTDALGNITWNFGQVPIGHVYEGTFQFSLSEGIETLEVVIGQTPWGSFAGKQPSPTVQQYFPADGELIVQGKGFTSGKEISCIWVGIDYWRTQDNPVRLFPTAAISVAVTLNLQQGGNVNFQHNDQAIASEPTIDFEDGGGFLWSLVDDPGNTRAKVALLTPQAFTIQAAVGQAVDILDIKNSTGAILHSITPGGAALFQPGGAATVPLTVQGFAAQSVDVFDVKNSAGSVLLGVDQSGNLLVAGGVSVAGVFNSGNSPGINLIGGNLFVTVGPSKFLELNATSGALTTPHNVLDDGSGNMSAAAGLTIGSGDIVRNGAGSGQATSWTAYTPSILGTGWVLGNGTIAGRYRKIDSKTIAVEIAFTIGSTTVVGNGGLAFSLPGGFAAAAGSWFVGQWLHSGFYQTFCIAQTAAGNSNFGMLQPVSNTNMSLQSTASTATNVPGNGDQYQFSAVLEIQ